MDEDEELYRLMNEEDEFYMGDKNENQKSLNNNRQNNNGGCLTLIVALFSVGGLSAFYLSKFIG